MRENNNSIRGGEMAKKDTPDLEDVFTEEITALFGNETAGTEKREHARRLARDIRSDIEANDPEEPTEKVIPDYK